MKEFNLGEELNIQAINICECMTGYLKLCDIDKYERAFMSLGRVSDLMGNRLSEECIELLKGHIPLIVSMGTLGLNNKDIEAYEKNVRVLQNLIEMATTLKYFYF